MSLSFPAYALLNIAFVLIISPLFGSIIKKVKAFAQGRKGQPLLQPYYNLAKLMRKETVYSTNSSAIMRITPLLNLAIMLVAALCIPLLFIPEQAYGLDNLIIFLYLLALAKFFMALAGLDAGSAFGGMGSSREMTLSAIIEPITIVCFAALAFVLNTTSIHKMFSETAGLGIVSLNAALLPLSLALFIILIAESARIPVDNPETHLELTMVHETMLLEHSGKNLAFMELSHSVKQTLLMALIINIFFSWGLTSTLTTGGIIISALSFLAKGTILAAAVGIFESSLAKMRLFRLPSLFMAAFFLSFLTILIEVFA